MTHHVDEVEASLGVVGPLALGESAQKFIHKYVSGSPTPQGWSHQLKNEPAMLLAWRRRYPGFWRFAYDGVSFAFMPHYDVTLGNVYTHASAGFNVQFTGRTEQWQDAPLRVRPAMPGTGFFEIPKHGFGWYVFAGAEARLVGRNIFLDGNTFAHSYSVHKKPLVTDLNVGFALTYDQVRLSYTLVRRSREFYAQKDASVFGALSLGYRF